MPEIKKNQNMKQKAKLLITFLIGCFISVSCIFTGPSITGNGNVVEENRNVERFNEISVSRGMNVYISQGDEVKVKVKADENLQEAIVTRNEGKTLKITASKNIRKATSKKVYVTVAEVSAIKATAGSNVFSETLIDSKFLEMSSSAGSNLKIKVNAEEIQVSASAGANVQLTGNANSFYAKASAGSNIKAEGLTTNDCKTRTSSGANIWISAKDNFEGHASSGGNIFYYGNPEKTEISKSSGGNVIKN